LSSGEWTFGNQGEIWKVEGTIISRTKEKRTSKCDLREYADKIIHNDFTVNSRISISPRLDLEKIRNEVILSTDLFTGSRRAYHITYSLNTAE
jgi:hypothetical protein